MNYNPPHKIAALQLLRAVAVLLVITAHAADNAARFGRGWLAQLYDFENFGAIGVDIFFVISGAIMTIITAGGAVPVKRFLLKRCIRIIPLYWTVSLFCLLLSFAGYWPAVSKAQVLETLTLVPVFTQGYLEGPVLFLGWTLSFEFFFYLVFSFSLFINKKQPLLPLFGILLSLVAAGLLLPDVRAVQFTFITNPVVLEFLAGCIGGYLYVAPVKIPSFISYAAITVALAALTYSVVHGFGDISEMERTWNGSLSLIRVIHWGTPSFLLVTGLVLLEKNGRLKVPRLAVVTGDSSYSAYLSHYIVIYFAAKAGQGAGWQQPDVFIAVMIVICTGAAYLLYRFVEKPVTGYLNQKLL